MPGLKEVRQRIKAVKGISQVTRAMKTVASVKLKRIQDRLVQARPYVETLYGLAGRLAAAGRPGGEPAHPLLVQGPPGARLLVVIGSDRGLCGSFNTSLVRHVIQRAGDPPPSLYLVGRKMRDLFARQPFEVVEKAEKLPFPLPWREAERLAHNLVSLYSFLRLSTVDLAYQTFIRPGLCRPAIVSWLPFRSEGGAGDGELRCEPSVGAVLDLVLPRALTARLHRALLESQASEQSARMMAMDNATTNATELGHDLTLLANKLRQSGITKELLEITTGAEALKN